MACPWAFVASLRRHSRRKRRFMAAECPFGDGRSLGFDDQQAAIRPTPVKLSCQVFQVGIQACESDQPGSCRDAGCRCRGPEATLPLHPCLAAMFTGVPSHVSECARFEAKCAGFCSWWATDNDHIGHCLVITSSAIGRSSTSLSGRNSERPHDANSNASTWRKLVQDTGMLRTRRSLSSTT